MMLNRKLFIIRLSQYFTVTDAVPQKCKSDLIYKCTCPQIDRDEGAHYRSKQS